MKLIRALLLVGLITQGFGSGPAADSSLAHSCVPTERMPIAALRRRPSDRMPTMRADMARIERMPVARLQPCYLMDGVAQSKLPARVIDTR